MDRLAGVVVSMALAACASVPVSGGGKDEILFARGEMIRILWNPQLTNEHNVRAKAIAYCGGREVDEVASPPDAAVPANLQAKTWQCQPVAAVGM